MPERMSDEQVKLQWDTYIDLTPKEEKFWLKGLMNDHKRARGAEKEWEFIFHEQLKLLREKAEEHGELKYKHQKLESELQDNWNKLHADYQEQIWKLEAENVELKAKLEKLT